MSRASSDVDRGATLTTSNRRAANEDGSGDPLIEIEDLQVYYRTVSGVSKAVDGVNLRVNRGEILGIAGVSGCGKSTLAGALLRLTRPPGYIAGGRIKFYPTGEPPMDLLSIDASQLRRV